MRDASQEPAEHIHTLDGKPSTDVQEETEVADKPAVPPVSLPQQAPEKAPSETANAASGSSKEEVQLENAVATDPQGLHAELPAQEVPKPADTAEHMQS